MIVLIRQMQVECSNPEARDSTLAWVGAYLINYAFVLAGAHAALIRIIQYLIWSRMRSAGVYAGADRCPSAPVR